MKNMIKKITILVSAILVIGNTFSTFATNIDTKTEKRENFNKEKNENMLIGKITDINAENITIELVTRKKREINVEEIKNNESEQVERKKPSDEEKYVSTGETKTYNITSTDFGGKGIKNSREEKLESDTKSEKMTYADYKIGDYVRITVDKENATIAKRIRNANEGFSYVNTKKGNYVGGYKGSYTGKTKAEKALE